MAQGIRVYHIWIVFSYYIAISLNPDFAVGIVARRRKPKRAVGAVLRRRHNHYYVEEQNRETSVAARIFKPQ
jgi:hypothetical protein